ncbi:MAG: hypothetical protein VXW65_03090 [Pseudomonadota bacterium]|nr:hypothetical protein [Pseudomonadota bacterium]
MPEVQIPLTEDEFALLQLAYQQLGHEHESPEHFANAAFQQVFSDIETDLAGGQKGRLMT